MRLDTVN